MRKQIVLVLAILLSTSMAQFSKNNPYNDFLSRCANGQIAQGYSLACQTLLRSLVLYRSNEGTLFDSLLILPSNAGIESYLKAKGASLQVLQKPSVSVSFAQTHLIFGGYQQKGISVSGSSFGLDFVRNKITSKGIEIAITGKEVERVGASYIFYVDNPLDFQNLNAMDNSVPIPEVDYQVKGKDVRSLSIFAIIDQCAKAFIFSEYSLSCQAIQNSGLLLRSQTLMTCFGFWATLLPTNSSLEHVLKEKNITLNEFVFGIPGIKFSRVHLGCLPSEIDDVPYVDSASFRYIQFEKWSGRMRYSNYFFKLSDRLNNTRFSSISTGEIYSGQLNGIAAQLLPISVQNYYKSYLRCGSQCEYFLLDKPLSF
jgi:hypothetical protein